MAITEVRTSPPKTLEPIRLAMFAPDRERCGVSDYSRSLIRHLGELPDIADIKTVQAPEDSVRGTLAALSSYWREEQRYRALGRAMNDSQLAHVQHQYFLFGGVAPHKSHIRAFLNEIRAPIVMTVHEIVSAGPNASQTARTAIRHVNAATFLHPRIARLIVHTRDDVDSLQRVGVAREKIAHLTLPAMEPLSMPDGADARRILGLSGRTVLTIFGFISAKKGYLAALEAFRRLPDDYFLLIAGDRHPDDRTGYVAGVMQAIDQLGLSSRARITGFIPPDALPNVLAATDIALAPFERTSGSASVAQLLAAGRAIIASDIAPLREIEADMPGCLRFYPSGSQEGLVAAILALGQDAALRSRYQAAALAYAEKHSWQRFTEATVQIYREIAAGVSACS
jgi:glycosyltransferase involved in cell wall biosynthesis